MKHINKTIDLRQVSPTKFIKFNREIFGGTITRTQIYNHKKKGFDNLSKEWQIKYICFKHFEVNFD